jgi:hypothetical protein
MKDLVPIINFRFEWRFRLYIEIELFIQITENFFCQIHAKKTEKKFLSQCGWYCFVLLQWSESGWSGFKDDQDWNEGYSLPASAS